MPTDQNIKSSEFLSLQNQTVLITGASSGFGLLLAKKLADLGAKLVLGDINQNGLDELAKDIKSNIDCELITQVCDVSSEKDCAQLVEAAVAKFGQLDIAVNNAGIAHSFIPFHEQQESEFDKQFAVNTKGVFFGMKHQIRQMMSQQHGIILNSSSMAGIGGAPKLAAYSAAKHGVVALTKAAAVEYATYNIRVNAICPFFSPTPMVIDSINQPTEKRGDSIDYLAAGSPMKRLGDPEEIVNTMIMMCSPSLSYMTGQTIAVDGGVSAF